MYRSIDELRSQMKLEWLHHPSRRMDNTLDDYLFSSNKQAFINNYPVRVDANTNNCPFFFNFLKPIHYLWKLPNQETYSTYPVFISKSLLLIIFLMFLITIFSPYCSSREALTIGNLFITVEGTSFISSALDWVSCWWKSR